MIALASYSVGRQQVHSTEAIPPSDFLDSVQGGFLKIGDIDSMLSNGEDAGQHDEGFQDDVEDDELPWSSQCHEDQAEDDQIDDYIADALVQHHYC